MAFILTLIANGCYHFQKAKIPIESIWYTQKIGISGQPDNLIVLLPGLGDAAVAFEKHDFIKYVRESNFGHGFASDFVAVNAHFRYYSSKTLIDRLKADIIDLAKARGYKNIHLLGVSLGGFGSLLYLRDHPEDIASVTLLAPYLGDEKYYQHIFNENLQATEISEKKNIWPWLERLPKDTKDKIFLGYGEQDKFAQANGAMGTLLVPGHVLTTTGKHRWTAWQRLWPGLLAMVKQKMVGDI